MIHSLCCTATPLLPHLACPLPLTSTPACSCCNTSLITPGPAPTSHNRKMVLEESSLFERDPVITFKHRISVRTLLCVLLEGILQRNPLSVFMLRSPSLSFCAHCGQSIKQTSIITALVDG
jgi:hypothetical protein